MLHDINLMNIRYFQWRSLIVNLVQVHDQVWPSVSGDFVIKGGELAHVLHQLGLVKRKTKREDIKDSIPVSPTLLRR